MESLKDRVIGIVLDALAYMDARNLETFMLQNEYREDERNLAEKQFNQCKHCYNKLMSYQYTDSSSIRMTEKKLHDVAFNLICG